MNTDPTDPPAAPDADEELYRATAVALDAPAAATAGWKRWGWLVASVALFAASFSGSFDGTQLLVVIGVLFLHEAGHLLGMLALGYRNVRVFFIPFFGAAVHGRRHAAPVWQQVVILYLGPLPGLLLGLAAAAWWPTDLDTRDGFAVLMLVAINAFNLLPFVPLDGGRVLDVLLFGRRPRLAVGFRAFAAAGLGGLAWWADSWCFGTLAGLTALSLPLVYRRAKRLRAFRGNPLGLPERLESLDDAHRRELFRWARLLNPYATLPAAVAAEMRDVHEAMVSRHPGPWGRALLLVPYLVGVGCTVAAVVLFKAAAADRHARAVEELVAGFGPAADAVQRLTDEADRPGADAAPLRAEADRLWGLEVARWKGHPLPAQVDALRRVVRDAAHAARPDSRRLTATLRLVGELRVTPDERVE